MDSSLVIKAKYGDTLRRFNVRVDENNRLDLNMVGLRAKICSVFGFAADANFVLRYVDEDGDLVTLVDDEDLNDVMRQKLKFLRIDVHMVTNSDVKSDADGSSGTSGSATPLRANPVSDPFLADALQALPEPMREALLLSFSKAASSNPVLANIADSISKIGQSILKPQGQSYTAGGSGSNRGVPDESGAPEVKGSQSPSVDSASGVSNSVPDLLQKDLSNSVLSKTASARQLLRNLSNNRGPSFAAGPSSKNNLYEGLVTSESRGPQFPFLDSVSGVNSQATAYNVGQRVEAENISATAYNVGQRVEPENISASRQVESGNAGIAPVDLNSSTNVNRVPLSSAVHVSADKGKGSIDDSVAGNGIKIPVIVKGKVSIDDSFAGKHERSGTSTNSAVPSNLTKNPTISFSAPFDCPFSGTHNLRSMLPTPPPLGNLPFPPFKRSHGHSEAVNGMFHKGVRCDGCGVYPITGPRFKSKTKENYDLCSICFNEFGNQTDYIKMDRPVSFRRSLSQHTKEPRLPKMPHLILKTGGKHGRPKLDSRFILDVNVIDGTMMAPSTPFTKIWRMRNNGTVPWPKGTQLVWIGGDKLSESESVDLEVPDTGISAEMELDIAVDFIAPQSPGRYISYWRMTSLSGNKFGQRVWVLIQVDASLKDSFYDSSQGLNLNIPLGVGSSEGPQIIDINVQPVEEDAFRQPKNPNAPPAPVNQMVDKELRQEVGNEVPTNKATFVSSAASAPAISEASSSLSYPIIDFSGTAPAISTAPPTVQYPIIDLSGITSAVPSNQQASTADPLSSSSLGMDGNDSVEEALLKELEEMGFKQIDLNKEVLRMNEYNLEQSIDELCGVSEWDPLLEELYDMGFCDRETNKRLLLKNDGSIKRVVMDLINGE